MPAIRSQIVVLMVVAGLVLPAIAEAQVELVGQWGGTPNAIAMRDNLAFVGVGSRLVVLDLNDPAAPHRIGQSQPLASWISRVVLDGERAYVAAGSFGFGILDNSDPTRPSRLGRVQVNYVTGPDWIRDIAVRGNLVFVAASGTG